MTYKQMQNFTYYQSKKGQGVDNPRIAPNGWYTTNLWSLKNKGIISQNKEGLYYLTSLGDKYKKNPYALTLERLKIKYDNLDRTYQKIYLRLWEVKRENEKLKKQITRASKILKGLDYERSI
jgi:hypothetical protein